MISPADDALVVASVMGVAAVGWIAYSLNAGGGQLQPRRWRLLAHPLWRSFNAGALKRRPFGVSDSHREYVFVLEGAFRKRSVPSDTYVRTVAGQPADAAQWAVAGSGAVFLFGAFSPP